MAEKFPFFLPILELLGIISVFTFAISLFIIPWIIQRIPTDYFLHLHETNLPDTSDPKRFVLFIMRNCVGALLFIAGVLMLFLPGQGILTIIIGLFVMSFPGKNKFIASLVSSKKIRASLNWSRKKLSRPPFLWEE